jgi:three-Cys-motif partner protein
MAERVKSETSIRRGPSFSTTASAARPVPADHEFGSQGTELKLSVVEAYLRAFTRALRGYFPELWYIDAFAGTGERTEHVAATRIMGQVLKPASTIRHRGSAKIAIEVDPPFDKLIFVEQRLE